MMKTDAANHVNLYILVPKDILVYHEACRTYFTPSQLPNTKAQVALAVFVLLAEVLPAFSLTAKAGEASYTWYHMDDNISLQIANLHLMHPESAEALLNVLDKLLSGHDDLHIKVNQKVFKDIKEATSEAFATYQEAREES